MKYYTPIHKLSSVVPVRQFLLNEEIYYLYGCIRTYSGAVALDLKA